MINSVYFVLQGLQWRLLSQTGCLVVFNQEAAIRVGGRVWESKRRHVLAFCCQWPVLPCFHGWQVSVSAAWELSSCWRGTQGKHGEISGPVLPRAGLGNQHASGAWWCFAQNPNMLGVHLIYRNQQNLEKPQAMKPLFWKVLRAKALPSLNKAFSSTFQNKAF